MAHSLFGNSWSSLPSHPEFRSNCEQELYTLMKEIDATVNKRTEQLECRLCEMQTQLEKKEEELESMKKELRICRSEMTKLQKKCVKQKPVSDRSSGQENNDELRKTIRRLDEEVKNLKSVIEIKEQQQKHAEASHQRLINIISELQNSMQSDSNQRSPQLMEHNTPRTPDRIHLDDDDHDWQKLLDKAVSDFFAQEEVHRERLEAKIMEEIENTKLKLSDIKISEEINDNGFKIS